jgi:hypothetical protein
VELTILARRAQAKHAESSAPSGCSRLLRLGCFAWRDSELAGRLQGYGTRGIKEPARWDCHQRTRQPCPGVGSWYVTRSILEVTCAPLLAHERHLYAGAILPSVEAVKKGGSWFVGSASVSGIRGFSGSVLQCEDVYRYYWFIVAFQFAVVMGALYVLVAGTNTCYHILGVQARQSDFGVGPPRLPAPGTRRADRLIRGGHDAVHSERRQLPDSGIRPVVQAWPVPAPRQDNDGRLHHHRCRQLLRHLRPRLR